MIVLALESSTSSAKAMLYDTEKGVLDVASQPFPASVSADGISDTEQVTSMTIQMGEKIARGKDVAAIALCGTWHNVAFCDKHLNPLGKTYSWNYIAPSESCAAMREDPELTNMLYQRTGCMPHTSYPRQALLYLKANGETLAGKQFISQGGYTFYLLTGEYCDSVSTVCGTGLMNVHTLKYDDAMLQLVGIREEQLPRVATYHDTCPLTQRGADLLGVPAGIPVVPAYPDGALNQIASCAAQVGKDTFPGDQRGHPFNSRISPYCRTVISCGATMVSRAGCPVRQHPAPETASTGSCRTASRTSGPSRILKKPLS